MSETATVTELLEVVRQLREEVGQLTQRIKELEAENQALRQENAVLREENTRLKKRINDLERKGRKYVAPHSREERKLDPQRPGRKPGEGTFSYRQTPEIVTYEITVETSNRCPACHFAGELQLSHFEKASITELPAGMRGEVTVYNVPSVPDNLGLTLSRTGEFLRLVFSLRCEREKAGVLKMCKLQPPPLPTVANSPYTSKPWCQPCVSTRFSASWTSSWR